MDNKIGMSFTYWCQDWSGDFRYYARKIAGLGYDVMEMSLTNLDSLSRSEVDDVKKLGEDLGLGFSFTVGLTPDRDLTVEDETIRRRGIEYVKRLLETAHYMGGDVLGGLSYCAWPPVFPPFPFDRSAYMDRAASSLGEVVKTAEDLGMTLCFEVVNRFDTFLFTTVDESVEFCKRVGSPSLKMHLDTFHMNIEEDPIGAAILRGAEHIGYFHVGETDRRPLDGKGRMDWDEFFSTLAKIDYRGCIIQEPVIRSGGQVGYDMRMWRDQSHGANEAQLDAMAKSSLDYIRAMCAKY